MHDLIRRTLEWLRLLFGPGTGKRRPGPAVRGGFGKTLTLAVTASYFDIFETQGFHPEPSDETRDAETLYLTFNAPPDGDTLVVSYDAYIQPAAQRGRAATVGVVDEGRQVAVVHINTRLLP